MKRGASKSLIELSVRVSTEAEDATVELLSTLFGSPASVYADTQKGTTRVSVYLERLQPELRRQLSAGLRTMRRSGLNPGSGRVSARRLPRENWAESWKRHFPPLEINSRLLILPSWSKEKPKRGQAVVILDPGLSFGTGHHPTTSFCLEQIAALQRPAKVQSLLDIGCGSGILSIAAAKLGYSRVVAFDFDPDAVRVAGDNAAMNKVSFNLSRRDLTKLPLLSARKFNVVCANLIFDLLIQERERILHRLAPDGTLVLAGILKSQFPRVERAFEELGWRCIKSRAAKEWRSGSFARVAQFP